MSTFLHRLHWCPYVAFYIAVAALNMLHCDTYVSEITHLVSFVFLVHVSKVPQAGRSKCYIFPLKPLTHLKEGCIDMPHNNSHNLRKCGYLVIVILIDFC